MRSQYLLMLSKNEEKFQTIQMHPKGNSYDYATVSYSNHCFSKLSDSHTRFLRNSETDVHIPRMRTSNGQKSFACCGAKVWNDLDSDTKMASSIQCFKSRLKITWASNVG